MKLVNKKLESNTKKARFYMEMYLSDVPSLTPKMIEILEFQGFNIKFEKSDNGLYDVWFGRKTFPMKGNTVGLKLDSYNLLKIQIKSMFDNLKENVWNEAEQSYMDTFEMVEKYVPTHNPIWKKWKELQNNSK